MRNAKLWSVLLAAVLLCACVAGILFTGASASDSRIPTATTTYVVGTDGATIRACLDKAAGETWGANDVLEIQFSGTDSSAYAAPDAANGISGYTLFETATIFRADATQLPIVIRGMDADRAAKITTAQNSYCATNDYFFTNLTIGGGSSGKSVTFYAGSGELVFENTQHNNTSYTNYYGDNCSMDAYEGWGAAEIAANSEDGLVKTGIVIGKDCTGLFVAGASAIRLSGVGSDGANNSVIQGMRMSSSNVKSALTDAQVAAVREAAPKATFGVGNIVKDSPVKPWNTYAYLILDNGKAADATVPHYTPVGARTGLSPVRRARVELISGGAQYLNAGDTNSSYFETYAGDTEVIMRGGRSGEKTTNGYSDVGIRLSNQSTYVGNLTLEIHEDNPEIPTYTPWIQVTHTTYTSVIFGDFHFLMTGGTVGKGTSGNDGYWGAPIATGKIVNEVRGGKLWAFYGSRYSNSYENTPISVTLPGTGEILTKNVTVHNKISGGEIGGLVDGKLSTAKGFWGQTKNSSSTSGFKLASVCNEITGGTIYQFNAGNAYASSAPGAIYNVVSGTQEKYPTFLTHFHGTTATVTTPSVTNVFQGYAKYQNLAGEKLSIYGGCKNGTVTSITNYFGGMPLFDDFYGGCSGKAPASGDEDSTTKGVAGTIVNTIALDTPASAFSNYVWGGNGYHTIKDVDGATETASNSQNVVTGSITTNVYGGHYGTFRGESACGKLDNVPITVNIYGGKWTGNYMPINRTVSKTNTSAKDSVVTTNVYGGEFNIAFMGGQNSQNRKIVNNIYGGTFAGEYYGGGDSWAKEIENNIYGGTFGTHYFGGGKACGFEKLTNNIYGGTFSKEHDFMGAYESPTPDKTSYYYADQTIENNFYGADMGSGWNYGGHRAGPTNTITNNFYSGEENPLRDPENELYKYFDADGVTTKESGTYFRDQFLCGSGYSESNIFTNRANSITNYFAGGGFVTGKGGTNITIRCGMRWGIVGDITTTFVEGSYYRVYGGCDYGYATGTITNNFGKDGEEGSALSFSGYVYGGGYDQTNGATLFSEKIATAKAAATPTATQTAWLNIADEFGDDFAGGANAIVNNVNYGTFHQFFGGSYGTSTSSQMAISHIGSITNNVNGGTFEKLGSDSYVFTGGCFRNAVIDSITNNVSGGLFNGNYFGGSIGIGTVECDSITNVFNGGEGNKTANVTLYLGNGAPTYNGTVHSTINDFTANMAYIFGGSSNTHNQPAGVEYGIYTEINGGTFAGFWGLGGGGSCVYNGNVKTVVNGGTFVGYQNGAMPNSIAGAARNGKLCGNSELVINDGVFTHDVVAGTIYGSYSAASTEIDGDVTLTIKGGSFKRNVYGVCRTAGEITCTGETQVNVVQTAGTPLAFYGNISIDNFTAIDEPVEIGKSVSMNVGALNGTLVLKQTEGWIARDYVVLPAGASCTVLESADCFGRYAIDDSVKVYGLGLDAAGATIILDTKLGARILFNKAEVDQIASSFEVEAKLGDVVLATADYESLEEYRGYYSIIVNGIGITDYAEDFVISGQASLTISMEDLVNMGQNTWTGNWLDLCNSLENFHNVYNLDKAGAYTPHAVANEMTARRGEAGAQIYSASASVLMTDAAGVRLNLILRKNPVDLAVAVNGVSVSDCATVTETEINGNLYYNVQIDLFFKAAAMETKFEISVSSVDGIYMVYGDTVANLAYQLSTDSTNLYKDNAEALLYYIQKASVCASAL